MLTRIIISVIPILIYITIIVWINWLINSKIKNKDTKTRYKQFLTSRLKSFFAPFFLFSVLIVSFLFPSQSKWAYLDIVYLVLKILLFFFSCVVSYYHFATIKESIIKLLHGSTEDIINDVD